ncbi:MAG TPA: succinate dehydrogenase, cytochrome b556 subunit [Alphaproteobacteria bacterium]|nr:succinate dehydrogenase, cytochrome b556 subunit [Alphaproteobacteria bacterium]HOO50706.1 succinate dehydrogenase, cytochrome b556 subunit [Alphaproteobacteria bacterium]
MSASQLPPRPLSPHIGIWKWSINMVLSILHRASGIALSVGSLMLVWFLASAATGPEAYDCFIGFATSVFGQILLFGWTGAMFFHLCSGIRHLIMDTGRMITIPAAEKAGFFIFVVSIALTFGLWGCIKFFF